LIHAIKAEDLDLYVVEEMIKHGANANFKDTLNLETAPPLSLQINSRNKRARGTLNRRTVNAFIAAAQTGRVDLLVLLLTRSSVDHTATDSEGNTALHIVMTLANKIAQQACLRLLLPLFDSVQLLNSEGLTPLDCGLYNQLHPDTLEFYLTHAKGYDLNAGTGTYNLHPYVVTCHANWFV
jgi:ankyrin repeat protein